MSSKRLDRVNELIKQELSKILEENFRKKDVLITVSYVKTSPDLKIAKAYISIFPFFQVGVIMEGLKEKLPRFQQILNEKVQLKYIPKIELFPDESLEYEEKMEGLFKKIAKKKNGNKNT